MFQSLKIKTLISAALLVLVAATVTFGGHAFLKQYRTYTAIHNGEHSCTWRRALAVAHEMQKECGNKRMLGGQR